MIDFSSLYKKYAPDVFRFALYLSGNHAQAEDIASETFVRAWTAPGPIHAETTKGYLFTIARNLFLHGLRTKSRYVVIDPNLRDPEPNPYAHAEQKQQLQVVFAALQQLPEIDRSALLMRAMDDMEYEEISRALGISLASVKVKIHRARLALALARDGKG